MASGEFTIAMVTLKSDRNDAMGLLRQWASGSRRGSSSTPRLRYADGCGGGLRRGRYRDAYLEDAERLLLETGYVCLVFYQPEQPAQQRLHGAADGRHHGGYYFSMWFSRTTDNRTKKEHPVKEMTFTGVLFLGKMPWDGASSREESPVVGGGNYRMPVTW